MKSLMNLSAVILLTLVSLGAAKNSPTADLPGATAAFRAGNAAYEQGRYDEAAVEYRKAVDLGASDARLYYNQGNALFRLNRLGEAVLAYERARKLAPSDADIDFNLRFAQSRIVDKVTAPTTNALTRVLWDLHAGYSLRAGLWSAFALFALAFAAIAVGLFLTAWGRIAALGISALAFCGLLAFSPSLWLRIHRQETTGRAVVLEPVAELYSGPGEKHELLFRAHEGTVFEIVERRGEWLSVKLPDGKGGFILARKTGEV
jgi:tetratricopeptide (TPR) repeat protein